jgi:hypothetical protein
MHRHQPQVRSFDGANGSIDILSDRRAASANPPTRRVRSETALKQITSLQNRRIQPGGLAKGSFPSGQGQMIRRVYKDDPKSESGASPGVPGASPAGAKAGESRSAGARFAKFTARPTTTHGSSPPEGQMARAPQTFRAPRNTTVGDMRGGGAGRGPGAERGPGAVRGPNLGGRAAGRGGPKGSRGPGGREQGPKKRDKKGGDADERPPSLSEIDMGSTLSDGMVKMIYRLQRQEWDRVAYEPKYKQGSFAANELIHKGREFFRGEVPPVKIWGRLEKTIGVVGMFGAEAHLKVTRSHLGRKQTQERKERTRRSGRECTL